MRAMRVLILIVVGMSLGLSLVQKADAGTSLGALAGLTRSSFSGDAPDKGQYRALTGFAFGGICEFGLTRNTSLCLQPSFIRKGTKIAYEVEGQKERVDSVDIRIDYFAVPVLVKVATRGGRFYVSGGLEFGFLLKAEYETSSEKTDIKEWLTDFDLAADFGVGLHVPVGRPVMFFELRYTQSIRDILDEDKVGLGLQPRVKNSGTQFYVGILYEL